MPKWEDIREDLFEAIIQVMGPLTKEQQAEVVRIMNERGHGMVWNAIRYGFQVLSVARFSIFFLYCFMNNLNLPPSSAIVSQLHSTLPCPASCSLFWKAPDPRKPSRR